MNASGVSKGESKGNTGSSVNKMQQNALPGYSDLNTGKLYF